MAKHKQMRDRMLNWADWKVRRQKDGIGRYARMRWEPPTAAESRMPWESDVVRPDEQDAGDRQGAAQHCAAHRAARHGRVLLPRSPADRARELRAVQVAKSTMFDRLDRVDFLLLRHLSATSPAVHA